MRIGFDEDPNDALFERIASLESQLREKDKTIELLQIRDDKRDARVSNMAIENGHLHALIEEKDKEIERLKIDLEAYKLSNEIHRKLI